MIHCVRLSAMALLLVGILWAAPALAIYTGPGAQSARDTVKTVIEEDKDTSRVILEGHIIRQMGHEKYLFRDDTGEIRLEMDNDILPREPFNADTKVRIIGIFDHDYMDTPEIDVDFITILSPMPVDPSKK